MNRRQGQPGDSIEAYYGVVSDCRPEDQREYYFMNTFPRPEFSSVHIPKRKKSKKKTEPRRVSHRGKQGKEERTSVNIPSRNLIVHNLPDVGGDLSVSLMAIHLGHCTHQVLNISGQECGIRVSLGDDGWGSGRRTPKRAFKGLGCVRLSKRQQTRYRNSPRVRQEAREP